MRGWAVSRVQGFGCSFRIGCTGQGVGMKAEVSGVWVWGLLIGISGLGEKVQGSEFGVKIMEYQL